MKVKLIPKCRRAENRIREHGEIFTLAKVWSNGDFCLFSLGNTFKMSDGKMVKWGGWFSPEEASYEEVKEHTEVTV